MNKFILSILLTAGIFLSTTTNAMAVQQTICFSKSSLGDYKGRPMWQASIGDNVKLYSGQCNGKKLAQMNRIGWRLVFVITGLDSAFGMVLEKK